MATNPAGQIRDRQKESAVDDDVERDIWKGNYSPRAMVGWWMGAVAISLLLPIVVALFTANDGSTWFVFGVLIVLMWGWLIGTALIRKLGDQYWLTSQRLKHRNGILFRQANRLELIDIDDVCYSQGPIQTLLGVGTIRLSSSDTSHPSLTMVGIRDVQTVADLIDDARREERRKRGLHIEAI